MKKVPGAVYSCRDGIYVALYSYWPDVYRAATGSLKNAERVAHVEYYCSGHYKYGGIDVFHCKPLPDSLLSDVNIKRVISDDDSIFTEARNNKRKICNDYNIKMQVLSKDKSVLYPALADVLQFCRSHNLGIAENPGYAEINTVERITSKTKVRKRVPTQHVKSGKQDFILSCALDANLDSSSGCISSFIPIDKNTAFSGDYFIGYYSDTSAGCGYCYAEWKTKCFPKFMIEVDKEKLLTELSGKFIQASGVTRNKKVNVLRLGKSTEAGSKYTLDELVKTLEICLESGTQVVMPTKVLEFNKEIAGLLKKTKSSVLYSLGYDELERGICAHGCTNEYRLEQARLYREAGVNSVLYFLLDVPAEPSEKNLRDLSFAEKNNIPVQLLPIRFYNKETTFKFTGKTWDVLRRIYPKNEQLSLPGVLEKGADTYIWEGNHLLPIVMNPFWMKLIGGNNGNVRMCHHDPFKTYCGSCFLIGRKGFIEETTPIKIEYHKKRWKRKDKKETNRMELFDGK